MPGTDKVKVFLSYSHVDENLKRALDAHLSALKYSNIIETWNDRKILAGEDWNKEIDQNLNAADVILLLVSSDFLASEFCYNIETRNALERHYRKQALVIPIVVREVDLRGLPMTKLQMLPTDGKAVTSGVWLSEDEAWKNVAEGVRRSIETFRIERSEIEEGLSRERAELETQYLDAVVPPKVEYGDTVRVRVLLRCKDSKGLAQALLVEDSSDEGAASAVRSEPCEVKFIVGDDKIRRTSLHRLTIDAPDLLVTDGDKQFYVESKHEPMHFNFFVKITSLGVHWLRVNLFRGNLYVSEVALRTTSARLDSPPGEGAPVEDLIASVKLVLNAMSKAASA
jgi:hypothetical protein